MCEEKSDNPQDKINEDFFTSLSARPYNCLTRAGITNVHILTRMTRYELSRIRDLGKKSQEEIIEALHSVNLYMRDEKPDDKSLNTEEEAQIDPEKFEDKISLLQLMQEVKTGRFPKKVIFDNRVYTWENSDYIYRNNFRSYTLLSSIAYREKFTYLISESNITKLSNYNTDCLTEEESGYVSVFAKISGKTPDRITNLYKGYRDGVWKLVIVFDNGDKYECDFDPSIFKDVPVRNIN